MKKRQKELIQTVKITIHCTNTEYTNPRFVMQSANELLQAYFKTNTFRTGDKIIVKDNAYNEFMIVVET